METNWTPAVDELDELLRRAERCQSCPYKQSSSSLPERRATILGQELERARLGRELHDSVSQSLALLKLQLQQYKQRLETKNDCTDASNIDPILGSVTSVCDEIHRIAHSIHPAVLNYFGLSVAAASLVTEFSDRECIQVNFDCKEFGRKIPADIALCVYRVLQEALQNVSKHSGSKKASIILKVEAGQIILSVEDYGCGFDLDQFTTNGHLGLVSMRERVEAEIGTFVVSSRVGAGTTITASIPLAAEQGWPS